MLAHNCAVLTNEFGVYKLIQDLVVGEYVFNPLTDEYVAITEILSTRVDLMEGFTDGGHPLCPILFEVGALSRCGPHKKVRTSPDQGVMVAMSSNEPRHAAAVSCVSAKALVRKRPGVSRQISRKTVDYYAIFTEEDQLLDVGGLLLQTLKRDIPEAVNVPPVKGVGLSVIQGGLLS